MDKKILFIAHDSGVYGANQSLINIVSGLISNGFFVLVVFPVKGAICDVFDTNKWNYIVVNYRTELKPKQNSYFDFIKNRNDIITNLNLSIKNLKKMDLISIKFILEKYNHQLQTITSDSYICSECNKIFYSPSSLPAHKKKHNNEKKKIELEKEKDKVIDF